MMLPRHSDATARYVYYGCQLLLLRRHACAYAATRCHAVDATPAAAFASEMLIRLRARRLACKILQDAR